jgi:hypothetical protein
MYVPDTWGAIRVEEDRIFMAGLEDDPAPPTDDEANDADDLPEPTEAQGEDVKSDEIPVEDNGEQS